MKFTIYISILLFLFGKAKANDPNVFMNSLEDVKKKAVAEHKGIFVLYYADWCGFCKKFQEETLTDNDVKKTLQAGFVSYRVLNSSEEGVAYKAAFYIKSLPTLLFFDENGDIKTMTSGFQSKEEFINLLKNIYKSYYHKPFPLEEPKLQLIKNKPTFKNVTQDKTLSINYSKTATCNDNNACTDDTENANGGCVFTPNNSNTCSDNSLCTTNDQCQNGVCIGTPITCPDDGNLCTTASCNPLTGCIQVNNSASCDDGNPCTLNDRCVNGVCRGTPRNCNDNNPCTTDSCDPLTGACVYTNNSASCTDNNRCTINDFCENGICTPGNTPLVCNDNNPCTDDFCDPILGCRYIPISNGGACNDNNVCTINDVCVNGNCTGTQISCPDDGNACTTASCNPLTGCFQVNNNNSCDDNNPCTVNDKCTNGICTGTPKSCDDGNPCTTDICDVLTGECRNINNTNSCNDGSACTSNDVCSDGVCLGTPVICNDNNTCTNDECHPATGCVFTPITNSLQISGLNYFQNTISGNVTKGAINNLFTILNTVPPTDPSYILTKIGVGANVGFFAGNSVTLNPGFQVPSGSVFKAEIKTCN